MWQETIVTLKKQIKSNLSESSKELVGKNKNKANDMSSNLFFNSKNHQTSIKADNTNKNKLFTFSSNKNNQDPLNLKESNVNGSPIRQLDLNDCLKEASNKEMTDNRMEKSLDKSNKQNEYATEYVIKAANQTRLNRLIEENEKTGEENEESERSEDEMQNLDDAFKRKLSPETKQNGSNKAKEDAASQSNISKSSFTDFEIPEEKSRKKMTNDAVELVLR